MLPVPPETTAAAPGDVAPYEAVQLFIDRARLVRPDFELTDASAPAVARICRRLDGHPLALELAAARLRSLSAEQIATRLDDRFRLLVGGSRAVAPRQRTLAATLDWSYELLSPSEQVLLRRLSVFAGGWTLEAAEQVAPSAEAADVPELLTGLVDKSLVQVAAASDLDEPRYWLLETVRQYAGERLSAAGELEDTRARHVVWAIGWVERSLPQLNGRDQVTWMRRIALEHDNFRVALEWSAASGDCDSELRLAAPLGHFWHMHGPSSEGRVWLSHALAHARAEPSLARAQALMWAGRLATMHGESGDDGLLRQAVAIADELGAYAIASRSRRYLALAVQRRDDTALTRSLYEDALRTARLGAVRPEEAFALSSLGFLLAQAGDISGAIPLIDAALVVGREVGDVVPVSEALSARGIVLAREERWAEAAALFEEALRLGEAIGDPILIVRSHAQLATLGPASRDLAGARLHARACITAAQNSGHQRLISAAVECFAELELEAGHYDTGVRLLAAVGAWRDASHVRHHGGGAPWMSVRSRLDQARAMLGESTFADAWRTGTLLSLESATAEAMETGDLRPPTRRPEIP
jgi:non-specific serine/threonine protein kinase